MPSILSVNVSPVRRVEYRGETIATGIFKKPVEGRVEIKGVQVGADRQADLDNHGGQEAAAYAYASEDYGWWSASLGRELAPGTFGENLTLQGIAVNDALVGERWRIGTATLEVTSPRVPCSKLAMVMDDPGFVKRFAQALRPGAYLRIVEPGDVAAGDPAEVLSRPNHHVTIADMARVYFFDRKRARDLLVPELTAGWRDWVLAQVAP